MRTALCCVVLAGFATLAAAQSRVPIKPGLWEIRQTSTDGTGKAMGDISDRLKKMPPESRARVEQGAEQRGVKIGPDDSVKLCFTAEQLQRDDWITPGNCRMQILSRSANAWKWRSTCSEPMQATTEGETRFSSDESFSTSMTTKLQQRGKTQVMKRESSGKWLGADCGSLKPATKG